MPRWLGRVLLFIVVLFFTNLIAAAVVGVLILKGVEVPAIIPFPVAVIGAILVFYKLVKKRNKEEVEDACPECHQLAPDHLDTCTFKHPDLR